MKIKCDNCGKIFNRRPSDIRVHNYCCKECRSEALNVKVKCENCGKEFIRNKSQVLNHVFCSRKCAKVFLAEQFYDLAQKYNPVRMTPAVRKKLRQAHCGKGEGKTYSKTYGRHTHRVVAEQMIGRSLAKGEVVHHIDGNKRNNSPLNLMVFKNQAEHALWHKNEETDPSKNYE